MAKTIEKFIGKPILGLKFARSQTAIVSLVGKMTASLANDYYFGERRRQGLVSR
ncbi:MAG: hypothetical protein QM529_06055 [Hydrotalea sp.]|nr:hypothetical protein [Hydrotalea sp.]